MRPATSAAQGSPMNTDAFFTKIRTYGPLSDDAERDWAALLRPKTYRKDEAFIRAGDVPARYARLPPGEARTTQRTTTPPRCIRSARKTR